MPPHNKHAYWIIWIKQGDVIIIYKYIYEHKVKHWSQTSQSHEIQQFNNTLFIHITNCSCSSLAHFSSPCIFYFVAHYYLFHKLFFLFIFINSSMEDPLFLLGICFYRPKQSLPLEECMRTRCKPRFIKLLFLTKN